MNNLSPDSRVWIYQSNRELNPGELISINNQLRDFCANWISHGNLVLSHFEILYNHFIVLMVDETNDRTCGSAVDASLNFIKELETEFNISLLDRMLFAYLQGEKVHSVSRETFEKSIAEGIINEQTIVFNNLVQTKAEFERNWKIPFGESWHAKLFANMHPK